MVSNRLPTDEAPAGGLIVALHDCLSETGGLWVGSAPDPVPEPTRALTQIGAGRYRRVVFDITQEEHEDFYLGYCNAVLWPLLHRRSDLIAYDARQAGAYDAVNARVARLLADELGPEDQIWIHDYHFLPLAQKLRTLGLSNPIGFFLHTPFPLAADLPALPQRPAFLDWIAAYDLVGVQTERDVSALLEVFRSDDQTEILLSGRLRRCGQTFRVASFPVGINVADFINDAMPASGKTDLAMKPDQKLLIGVDRLDYSKGLVQRFEAFEAFLDKRDKHEPRATFLQIAPLSRSDLGAYRDIRQSLEATAGRINGRHSELDWTPIRYLSHGVPRAQIAGLLRQADIGLVTPLADGMNLVAKEFVAAQDPADPGVLILSHFAGAAEQMPQALLVNPYDAQEMATAMHTALAMPLNERQARHAEMLEGLKAQDVAWWTRSFLTRLAPGTDGADGSLQLPQAV